MSALNQHALTGLSNTFGAFSPAHAQLVKAASYSKMLTSLLNTYFTNSAGNGPSKNRINIGAARQGTYSTKNAAGDDVINIDPDAMAVSLRRHDFARSIAHELGHMLGTNGHSRGSFDPAQMIANGGNAEGVALTYEFIVAQQLGSAVHLNQGQWFPRGQLGAALIHEEVSLGITSSNVGDLTFGSSLADRFTSIASPSVAIASAYALLKRPSNAPNLTYAQYYSDWIILSNAGINPRSVNWSAMPSSSVPNFKKSCGQYAYNLPNIPIKDGTFVSISGVATTSGIPINEAITTSNGDATTGLITQSSSLGVGPLEVSVFGVANVYDKSSMRLPLGGASDITVGPQSSLTLYSRGGDTIDLEQDSIVTLNRSSAQGNATTAASKITLGTGSTLIDNSGTSSASPDVIYGESGATNIHFTIEEGTSAKVILNNANITLADNSTVTVTGKNDTIIFDDGGTLRFSGTNTTISSDGTSKNTIDGASANASILHSVHQLVQSLSQHPKTSSAQTSLISTRPEVVPVLLSAVH